MNHSAQQVEEYRLSSQQCAAHVPDWETALPLVAALFQGPALNVDLETWRHALEALAARHEVLRTRYRAVPGLRHPVQYVVPGLAPALVLMAPDTDDEALLKSAKGLVDARGGAVLGMAMARSASTGQVRLALAAPRYNLDVRGLQQVAAEGLARCLGLTPASDADAQAPLQYVDYAAWQEALWASELGQEGARFWEARSKGGADEPRLPFACTGLGKTVSRTLVLEAGLCGTVKALGVRLSTSTEAVMMGLWAGWVSRMAQMETFSVEWTCTDRSPELEDAIGRFETDLPLSLALDKAWSAESLVKGVSGSMRDSASWSECFNATTGVAQAGAGMGFSHGRIDALPGGWSCRRIDAGARPAKLRCESLEMDDGRIALHWFSDGTFDEETLTCWQGQFSALLASAVASPQAAWTGLPMLGADEAVRLLRHGRIGTEAADKSPVLSLHALFEESAARRPQAQALVCGEVAWTYRELDRRANRLAHALARQGVVPGDIVGIHIGRDAHAVAAMLGALKAGAAYVPIDPAYPAERIDHVLSDAGVGVVMALASDAAPLMARGLRVLAVDQPGESAGDDRPMRIALAPDALAYVIYTSGSTGLPKGVMVSHANAVASTLARFDFYKETVSCYLLLSSFSFDSSVAGIFWTLAQGGMLCVPMDDEHQDPAAIGQLAAGHRVSHMLALPSFYKQLLPAVAEAGTLRCAIVAGEACHAEVVARHRQAAPQAWLVNEYGPTEGTVWSHAWRVAEEGDDSGIVPIGQVVASSAGVVLDKDMALCPVGIPGELYIGGAGIARGYLSKPGLTAQRFVAHPFVAGQRLYRTGDLVRCRADGALEYLGRIDHQVKIRGFRVELGEVEAQLLAQPGVQEAVVVANEGPGGLRLVAYVSPGVSRTLDSGALRESLGKAMPAHLVPSAIVVMEGLPHTPNGKVDRQALPHPDAGLARAYEAPVGEVELALCAVWQDVLGVARVGRSDNFFELGGDSILGLQITARMRQAGWRIVPKQLFDHQTVARLALVAERTAASVARVSDTEGEVPLLPIQAAFFEQAVPERHHWNQAVLLRPRDALDITCLQRAMAAAVRHHDALRLRFRQQADGRWIQEHASLNDTALADVLWVRRATSAADIEPLCLEAQRSLDLQQGPLLRALAIELPGDGWRLMLAAHHLVIDGVSWRVLLEDIQAGYEQSLARRDIVLPEKTSSYKDWSLALQADAARHGEEMAHWLTLSGVPAELPCDHPEGGHLASDRGVLSLRLTWSQTEALLKQAPAAYRTQVNDILLTALGRALCAWTGQDRILVDLEGHGREDVSEGLDLSRTVGWFTSVFPVALSPLGDPGDALKRVKEALRDVPRRGLGHGVLRHLGSAAQQAALRGLPPARVNFNYLGQFDGSFEGGAFWLPAEESCGAMTDGAAPQSHEFSINGRVQGGELCLDVGYSAARYERATVQRWVDRFRDELQALVDHCTGPVRGVTPSDFPLARVAQSVLDQLPMPLDRLQHLYALSPIQSGILFHSVYDVASRAYVNQLRVDIEGLDANGFKAAWQAAVARHDVLRTGFLQGDKPLQWVAASVELPWRELDWCAEALPGAALDALAQAELDQGFDLAEPPLMRMALVRLSATRHHFVWTSHHLLIDGWSTAQLLSEVIDHHAGRGVPTQGGRYRDYIGWLAGTDHAASLHHWDGQLAPLGEPSLLAPLLSADAGCESRACETRVVLTREQTEGLAEAAASQRVTVNTLVQAAWSLLISRCLGQDTICFGATVAGRPDGLPGAQQTLGVFINTLPVCVPVPAARPVGDWLRDIQARNVASREHEQVPLPEILRRSGHGQALFDTIVVFENYPIDQALLDGHAAGGLRFANVVSRGETHYPLTLVVQQGEGLALTFGHDAAVVDEGKVRVLAETLAALLPTLAAEPSLAVGEVSWLKKEEHERLRGWSVNGQVRLQEGEQGVHRLIEAQAAARGGAPALVFEGRTLSYGELNARANRVAHRLRTLGVVADLP
ncbi:MAG: amino acid adenylation domain-containing protein, partial [Rubrivivax sp.]